jgi:hypothetical protein
MGDHRAIPTSSWRDPDLPWRSAVYVAPKGRQEFIGCGLGGTPKVVPKVVLDASGKTENPFFAVFRDCGGLMPDHVVFGGRDMSPALDGSIILIEHADGRAWEVAIEDGEKVVTDR